MKLGLHRTPDHHQTTPVENAPPHDDGPGVLGWIHDLCTAERACCCTARPTVTVVLPTAPRTGLLMCGHHYRAHRSVLEGQGAVAYDERGAPVTGEAWTA